jgi:hypothetical protein
MNLWLYFIDVVTSIHICLMVGWVFMVIGFLGFVVSLWDSEGDFEDLQKQYESFLQKRIIIFIVITVIIILIPTKQSMYMMLANSYLNSKDVSAKVIDKINKVLE